MHKTANRECKELSVNLEWILYFKILVVAKGWEHQRTRYRKAHKKHLLPWKWSLQIFLYHLWHLRCFTAFGRIFAFSIFITIAAQCFAAQLSSAFYEYHMILCSLFIHWLCWKLISFVCNIKKWLTCFKYRTMFPSYYI